MRSAGVSWIGDRAGVAQLVVAEAAGPDDDRRHPGVLRRLDVVDRVADHDARGVDRLADLLQRDLEQVRRRLGLLDVLAGRPAVGEVAGVEQVQCPVDVVRLAGAGQHHAGGRAP